MESTEVNENPFSSPILEKKRFPINYLILSLAISFGTFLLSHLWYPEKLATDGNIAGIVIWSIIIGSGGFFIYTMGLHADVELMLLNCLSEFKHVRAQIQTLIPSEISRYLSDRGVTPTKEEIESLTKELTSGIQDADVVRGIKILDELKIGRVSPFQIPGIKREIKRLGNNVASLHREKWKRETRIITEIEKMTRVISEHMKQDVPSVEHVRGMPDHVNKARIEIENTAEKLRVRYRQGNLSLEEMRAFYKELTEKVIQPREEIEKHIVCSGGVVMMKRGQ